MELDACLLKGLIEPCSRYTGNRSQHTIEQGASSAVRFKAEDPEATLRDSQHSMASVIHELQVGGCQPYDDQNRQGPGDWAAADGARNRNRKNHPHTHGHHQNRHAEHRPGVVPGTVVRFLPLCHFYYPLS
ncbi:MAG: hypothetical protein IT303_08440 [Dehalococcoidia bacterium]|nr:hypothetical protein [Dehalococcoidia bacterium]